MPWTPLFGFSVYRERVVTGSPCMVPCAPLSDSLGARAYPPARHIPCTRSSHSCHGPVTDVQTVTSLSQICHKNGYTDASSVAHERGIHVPALCQKKDDVAHVPYGCLVSSIVFLLSGIRFLTGGLTRASRRVIIVLRRRPRALPLELINSI